jgi:hypothetical protein
MMKQSDPLVSALQTRKTADASKTVAKKKEKTLTARQRRLVKALPRAKSIAEPT